MIDDEPEILKAERTILGNIASKIIFNAVKEGAVKIQNTSIFMVLILLTLIFSYAC
jgi:hypothetical protein